jgi:hypothetical protein
MQECIYSFPMEPDCSQYTDESTCNADPDCEWDYEMNECKNIMICECDITPDYCDPDCPCDPDCIEPGGEFGMCDDGIDNDNDGMADCDDPDCGDDPACFFWYNPCEDQYSYYYGKDCSASISGTVTSSADASPVADAWINFWEEEGGYGVGDPSKENGSYIIKNLPSGFYYHMNVEAPYGSNLANYQEEKVWIEGAVTKNIQLSAGGSIS